MISTDYEYNVLQKLWTVLVVNGVRCCHQTSTSECIEVLLIRYERSLRQTMRELSRGVKRLIDDAPKETERLITIKKSEERIQKVGERTHYFRLFSQN